LIVTLSIISLFCTAVYLLLLCYLIRGWARVKSPVKVNRQFSTKVTILIAARNEEEKIALTIEDILAQDYPKELFDIIIADDHSTDRTAEIITCYADRKVKLLQLHDDKALNSYKKRAIAEAIKLSTGDFMVATDADCRMGPQWLSTIISHYETNDLVMISSPVAYFEEHSLFEYMQSLEFMYLIGVGAAFIGNGKASTCNGANFAYRKDVFNEVGGFKGIDELASGDDELLLQKVAAKYPNRIGFLKSRDAVVYTHAKPNVKEFMQQRRRWASKSTSYKDKKVVAFVVLIWLFNVTMLLNTALGFYDIAFFKLLLVQVALKYAFEFVYLYPITKFFGRIKLISLLILIIPVHVLYMVYIGTIKKSARYNWKGRHVR
jgi:cellulose synthase/poly-beta-1,6-N-acetylglucosamine synthase-like glycosyltransferase